MKLLWKLVKVAIALAIAIPLSIIALTVAVGFLGGLLGLAILALKLAVACLLVWGAFRLVTGLVRGSDRRPKQNQVKHLPPADPYYDAAMRELDREMGNVSR